GGAAILAADDEIAEVIGQKVLRSVRHIVEIDAASGRHAKPKTRATALGQARVALHRAELPAGPRIAGRAPRGALRAIGELELRGGAKAGIGQALRLQALEVAAVHGGALRLQIGPMRATAIRTLIPAEAQPAEILEERLRKALATARSVGILHAQHEAAGAPSRQQAIEQCRACIAQVQLPRGTGRKACDDRLNRHPYNVA